MQFLDIYICIVISSAGVQLGDMRILIQRALNIITKLNKNLKGRRLLNLIIFSTIMLAIH